MKNVKDVVASEPVWVKSFKGEALITGCSYNVNGEFLVYAGDFKSTDEVPRTICCYTIGDEMHCRHVIPNFASPEKINRRKRSDDDRPIDTNIKDTDNTLMVMIKTGFKQKGITRGDFKEKYTSDSDMNNALRCIENGDNLSWARFTDLCQRFSMYYDLCLYDADGQIEEIDTGGRNGKK